MRVRDEQQKRPLARGASRPTSAIAKVGRSELSYF
jgi:hypothetical protein